MKSSQSTLDSIHVNDLELILNGLGFFPGDVHLDEMSFEIRFRQSHLTWEVSDDINVDEFCQLIENYSNWLYTEKNTLDIQGNLNEETAVIFYEK